jgi:hypothetical protein
MNFYYFYIFILRKNNVFCFFRVGTYLIIYLIKPTNSSQLVFVIFDLKFYWKNQIYVEMRLFKKNYFIKNIKRYQINQSIEEINKEDNIKKVEIPSPPEKKIKIVEMPTFPENCCGNNCVNCVFYEYYEKLEKYNEYINYIKEEENNKTIK